jgi:hypothetical protein
VLTDYHVDCTESRTYARLHHDCQPGEGCPYHGQTPTEIPNLSSSDPP